MICREKGFTLIETLVSIALTSVIITATVGLSLTMAWTYYGGVALHQVQREVVFSMEAVYDAVKLAKSVDSRMVGGVTTYTVTGLKYEGGAYTEPQTIVRHNPATNELFIGGRRLSRNVASFSITGTDADRLISIGSVSRFGLAPSGRLPVSLDLKVLMRNYGRSAGP